MDSLKYFAIGAALGCAALINANPADAKDSGLFIGGSVGQSTINEDFAEDFPDLVEELDLDDTEDAFKIFGGYQVNKVVAIEAAYVDLGERSAGLADLELTGIPIYGVFGAPLGPVWLFGKVGGVFWESEVSVENLGSVDDDGFELTAGAGLELRLGRFGIRGEAEYFDVLNDTWLYSVGGRFTF